MATALQQQLAQIATKSTHQLDLKAQKSRHSESLLFEPRDASTQSFDTLFQICVEEGFDELCELDGRFAPFSSNIFAESSKDVDRTQLTAKENAELDDVVQNFLGLVQGRLLIRPAIKSVEWLVRRFRIHEYSTESLLLAFLPYHTADMFSTVLNLLSAQQLTPAFKWLHPYIASLQAPRRSAILSAISSNAAFFSAFNTWVLRNAKSKHHSAILLGFWASLMAQAVNAMLDSTASGRENVRKQREEDLVMRVLPVLQDALGIRDTPELYLGSCMIITILVAKAQLQDNALDAILEAVIAAWTAETANEGLICLAAVAEEKHELRMNRSVTKSLLEMENIVERLQLVGRQQRVVNLTAGLALGATYIGYKTGDASQIAIIGELLVSDLLDEQGATLVLRELMARVAKRRDTPEYQAVCQRSLEVIDRVSSQPAMSQLLDMVKTDIGHIKQDFKQNPSLASTIESAGQDVMELDEPPGGSGVHLKQQNLQKTMNNLPPLAQRTTSFLDISVSSEMFQTWAIAFHSSLSDNRTHEFLARFRDFEKHEHMAVSSFFARVWTSKLLPAPTRVAAINTYNRKLAEHPQSQEGIVEALRLLPYILAGLADTSANIRKASAELCASINSGRGLETSTVGNLDQIYGNAENVQGFGIASVEVKRLLSHAIVPILEDCVLDTKFIERALADTLNDGKAGSEHASHGKSKEVNRGMRSDLCVFFAAHAVAMPLPTIQLWLLKILSKVGKSAMTARKDILVPFLRNRSQRPATASTNPKEYDTALFSIVTHRSSEEVQLLLEVISGDLKSKASFQEAAFQRTKQLFPVLKSSQRQIVDLLLELANGRAEDDLAQSTAMDLLRTLSLPTEILVALVENLPSVSDMQEQSPVSKKRRFSRSETTRTLEIDQTKLQSAIRQITLILELVESSKPEQHSNLLRGLFHFLSELHHYKAATGSDLVYLHQILLGSILSIINALATGQQAAEGIDNSAIRTDLIVECLRTTKSTQIHNTALLLVSRLAAWKPELVLHSVMPLFTFMSTTVLRQSDDYSAHVTDETVAKIVPPLAGSLKKRGKDIAIGAAELLLSFAAAYEHVPLQRRLPLFELLVETLGTEDVLFAVIAMLNLRYQNEPRTTDFVRDLSMRFDASTVLTTASKYLDLVRDGFQSKRGLSDILLSFNEKTQDEIQASLEALLHGLSGLLEKDVLRAKISVNFTADSEQQSSKLRTIYAEILEKAVHLTQSPTSVNEDLNDAADSVLRAVLGLLPTAEFINSSAALMQAGSDATRQQVFRSLEIRAHDAKRGNSDAQRTFLGVLPGCAVYIQLSQPLKTRHAAIACIDQISEKFGRADTAAVLKAAASVTGDAALGSEERDLRIISLLALASLLDVLGDESVGFLPEVLHKTISYLEECVGTDADFGDAFDQQMLDAGFSLLVAVLNTLPWMLSASNLDLVIKITDRVAPHASDSQWTVTHQELCNSLAKKVPAPELFSALERTWPETLPLGEQAILQHLSILHLTIKQHTKSTVTKNAPILFAIMFKAFDLRRELLFYNEEGANDSREGSLALVVSIAMDLTLKLNDANFRPFFMQLIEWASAGLPKSDREGRKNRLKSVYGFTSILFEQLQSLVTSYSSFLLDTSAEVLQERGGGKESRQLLDAVLKTLSSSFHHDQNDFWQAPAHFEAMASPLISHLKSSASAITGTDIIKTTTDFAGAASSPEHLKSLNTALLLLMKDNAAEVRLAAVKCERSITERLSLEWLTLLPEMLPAISELMEDDNEDVEREVLRWIGEIEEATGESLEGMLA